MHIPVSSICQSDRFTVSSADQAIRNILQAYRNALVASDAASIVPLYAKDGVTMAQHSPTQIGHPAIKEWYVKCFEMLTLDVEFNIEEVFVVSDEYAFARTSSEGTQKINATGQTGNEANQELFVMQKAGGEWKIAR
jgi:uncharacterized protein (TIGR02246 family)